MITERIDAVTLIPDSYRVPAPPAPKSVKIELTSKCNYRCGFCALRTRERHDNRPIDWSLFARITAEMREAGVEEIGLFFLGESFSEPALLLKAIRHCKGIGFPYVFLTTNGSLAKPDIVREAMLSGLDSLKFSMNWADAEQFSEIAGVKSLLWERAIANLKAARKVRDSCSFRTKLYASSIAYDGEQADRMQSFLVTDVLPYVDQHYFLPLYSMGSFATRREEELGYRPIAGNQGRLGALRDPLPCWSAFTEGHVTSRGVLSACCFDASDNWSMADLNDVPFMAGWHSLDFRELREAHLRKDVTGTICENCVAYA